MENTNIAPIAVDDGIVYKILPSSLQSEGSKSVHHLKDVASPRMGEMCNGLGVRDTNKQPPKGEEVAPKVFANGGRGERRSRTKTCPNMQHLHCRPLGINLAIYPKKRPMLQRSSR